MKFNINYLCQSTKDLFSVFAPFSPTFISNLLLPGHILLRCEATIFLHLYTSLCLSQPSSQQATEPRVISHTVKKGKLRKFSPFVTLQISKIGPKSSLLVLCLREFLVSIS